MSVFNGEITVRRTRFAKQSTGWAVVEAIEADDKPIVLVGPLIHLEDRGRAYVLGKWVTDSRFGPQVKVSEARPLPPSDAAALVGYLRRVRHVGVKRAAALVERYGPDDVLDAIDRDPRAAFAAAGIAAGALHAAAASWDALRVGRHVARAVEDGVHIAAE